jgi:hypothetical protein
VDRDVLAAQARAESVLQRRREVERDIAAGLEQLRARRERHPNALDGVDLDERALPAAAERVEGLDRAALEALSAREGSLVASLEARLAELARASATLDAIERGRTPRVRLGPPPRAVPFAYVVAEAATWRVAIAAGAAFILLDLDLGLTFLSVVLLALFVAVSIGRAVQRRAFLARCVEADEVTVLASAHSVGKTWPFLYGQGWDAEVRGHGRIAERTRLAWRAGSLKGELRTVGPPWNGGIVLVDPAGPEAVTLADLPSAPRPDVLGRWNPTLRARVVWRCAVVAISLLVWLIGLAYT